MLCLAQTGGRVKNKRRFFGGLKTRVIFYEKDKNRIAKLEFIIIYKRRSYQSIYRGIYVTPRIAITTKLVWGGTRFGIRPQTDMGIPIPVWGLAFLSFF